MSEHDWAARKMRTLIERMKEKARGMYENALDDEGREKYEKACHDICELLEGRELVSSTVAVFVVASACLDHVFSTMDIELMLEDSFGGFKAYSQAKLANIIFSYELDRRWRNKGITANAMHPGAVSTNFGSEAKPLFRNLMKISKPLLKTPEKGADTIVYLATSDDIAEVSGKYFINRKQVKSNGESYNPETGRRLWEVSEELSGLK